MSLANDVVMSIVHALCNVNLIAMVLAFISKTIKMEFVLHSIKPFVPAFAFHDIKSNNLLKF